MLQRIQSVYFLLAGLVIFALFLAGTIISGINGWHNCVGAVAVNSNLPV